MFETALLILMSILSLSLVMAVIRLASGPSVPDRIVALQVVVMHGMGLVTLYALREQEYIILNVLIPLAVVELVSTLALTHYIERGGR